MTARAAIALSLAALAFTASARAADDPACAQYREPMAYNLCLARHGPKANGVGQLPAAHNPAVLRQIGFGTDTAAQRRARASPQRRARGSTTRKAPSASMVACTWSFVSIRRWL